MARLVGSVLGEPTNCLVKADQSNRLAQAFEWGQVKRGSFASLSASENEEEIALN